MRVKVILDAPPPPQRRKSKALGAVRSLLLIVGVAALSYVGYVFVDAKLDERRQESALDRSRSASPSEPQPPRHRRLSPDQLIGRIMIPRLNIKAVVKEGVEEKMLRRGVGHVPETVLPWEVGNVGLAGHRDSFFRGLKDVRRNDTIRLETTNGDFEYVVESTKIVDPDDVQVLARSKNSELTLVTCYPFYYVGKAPRRFIVRARQILPTEARNISGS